MMANTSFITINVDVSGAMKALEALAKDTPRVLKTAVGTTGYRLQQLMRQELNRLIYSTPESPTHKRTWTLYRSTHASRPGADHSREHDAAKAGVDLGITLPAAYSAVKMDGYEAAVDVGAYADYSSFVHEGHGLGRRVPKPFSVKPAEAAAKVLQEELALAIAASVARHAK